MQTKNEIDVIGFKKGLAAIMSKHHMTSIRSEDPDEALLGFDHERSDRRICAYEITFRGDHPGKLWNDVVEIKKVSMGKFGKDLMGLFKFYEVQCLTAAADENFWIGFDDGDVFKFENVNLEGIEEND